MGEPWQRVPYRHSTTTIAKKFQGICLEDSSFRDALYDMSRNKLPKIIFIEGLWSVYVNGSLSNKSEEGSRPENLDARSSKL